jgi:hypothetical protein
MILRKPRLPSVPQGRLISMNAEEQTSLFRALVMWGIASLCNPSSIAWFVFYSLGVAYSFHAIRAARARFVGDSGADIDTEKAEA